MRSVFALRENAQCQEPFHAPRAHRSHLIIKPMIKWLLLLPLAWLVSVAKEPLDPKICLQPLPIAAYTDRQTTPPRIPAP